MNTKRWFLVTITVAFALVLILANYHGTDNNVFLYDVLHSGDTDTEAELPGQMTPQNTHLSQDQQIQQQRQQQQQLLAGTDISPFNSPTFSPNLHLFSNNFTCDSQKMENISNDRKVYWGIFAGRRDRLRLQEKYWVQLFEQGLITEVHLWDFTRRDKNLTERVLNKDWIKRKASQYKFVKVIHPKPQPVGFFNAFYQFYAQKASPKDVIVKVDDDIVFVNVSEFKCFVKFVAQTEEAFTVSANVVNNGVIAHFQQALGSIPMSLGEMEFQGATLWQSSTKAYELHRYFTDHPEEFYKNIIIRYWMRVSINFIAYSGRKASDIYNVVCNSKDDGKEITVTASNNLGAVSLVYMRFVVAHVTFYKQTHPPRNNPENLSFV